MAIDDNSLWILIHHFSTLEDGDVTVCDLARRIIERDLFKHVPLPDDRVGEYLQQERARENIYNVIQPHCDGEREYYLIVDEREFSMLSEDPSEYCYFIDDKHQAKAVRDDFVHLRGKNRYRRLFTVEEAIGSVLKLIGVD